MDFSRVIQDLLQKNESVSIPQFGSFTLKYVPAQLYKFTNRIAPPQYEIEFSPLTKEDDFRLVTVLAMEYDMPANKAGEKLNTWIADINRTLEKGNQFEIKNIGTLQKTGNDIKFVSDKNSALFADSFGLETANIPLFEIEEAAKIPLVKEKSSLHKENRKPLFSSGIKKWLLVATIIFFIVGGIAVMYDAGLLDKPIKLARNLFKSKPSQNKEQFATNDTLNGKIDANELKRKALTYSENKTNTVKVDSVIKETIRYYLIAGSFKTLKNADIQRNEMVKKGYTPEIINLGDTLYRISLATFTERSKAVEEYIALTHQDTTIRIWLFSKLEKK